MRRFRWSAAGLVAGLLAGLSLAGCGGGGADVTGGRAATGSANTIAGRIKSLTASGGALSAFVLQPRPLPGQPQPPDATIAVTAQTTYRAGDKAASAADLKVGMGVEVVLKEALRNNRGTATVVRILPPVAAGRIKSLTPATGVPQSFVLQAPPPPPGQAPLPDLTIALTAQTKYTAGDKTLAASDLKVGMPVEVVLQAPPKDNRATAVAVNVLPPKAVGKVKSTSPATGALQLFVLQPPLPPAGQTAPPDLTVRVTAQTRYTKGNQPATAADVKAGVFVEALLAAPPKDNAATANAVNLLPPPAQ
ncbi:MAG: hypothetical protein HYU66_25975 [Armatimonadetes bacterium]|nr:hypothetical protein [Armatimonadota bacterium]